MNERIRELEKQCWDNQTNHLDAEKFAQMSIEECAKRCDVVRESNGGDRQFGARLCADEIRWMNRRS
jgi:hypothetical protein